MTKRSRRERRRRTSSGPGSDGHVPAWRSARGPAQPHRRSYATMRQPCRSRPVPKVDAATTPETGHDPHKAGDGSRFDPFQ